MKYKYVCVCATRKHMSLICKNNEYDTHTKKCGKNIN